MSKKMMLLALAVAAMFAIPSAASAQEIHLKNVTTFSGTGPPGFLIAENEPKISCTSTTASGKFDTGSTTTGTTSLTFSGCTATFLGLKGNCNTAGDSTGIITSSGTFHLITIKSGVPGILVTPVTTTIVCIGFSRVEVTGPGIIGTITQPTCKEPNSKVLKVSFGVVGSSQEHPEYTEKPFDLSATTENSGGGTTGVPGTAGLEGSATLESATEGTLECT